MKKASEKIVRIGLVANSGKPGCRPLLKEAARIVLKAGRRIFSDAASASLGGFQSNVLPDIATLARQVDLLLVFGGDGTILRVVREMNGAATPILGINVGRLGFLTAVPSKHLVRALEKVWGGEFIVETRRLIQASGQVQGAPLAMHALNDVVITRGAASRMIELKVEVNDGPLTSYRCDGLIVSSPTGSTAYSLSAGGAIISPQAEVISLTPICPHTLSNRSVIVNLNSTVRVTVVSERVDTIVVADGQVQSDLNAGDVVTIQRSKRAARLVQLSGTSFFETVRRKLHWSGSNEFF